MISMYPGEPLRIGKAAQRFLTPRTSFPDASHLKSLTELYLRQHAFESGREQEESQALWAQANASAVRRKMLFDEAWFETVLYQYGSQAQPAARCASCGGAYTLTVGGLEGF